MKDWEQAMAKDNQFTRSAIVDVYLTCSEQTSHSQPIHVQCLHICNCRLCQAVASYCSTLLAF